MSQTASMNPWLSMWSQPKSTVRALVHSNAGYGVFYLASIFALQSFFFYANWWSLGLNTHFYTILLAGLILSPLIGFIWIYYLGYIFYFTGKWLGGSAPVSHLRTAIAWSKIPSSISLLMWIFLVLSSPTLVFIQDAGGPSSIFINFITLILSIWSLVLLIQGISELQEFSTLRSISNVLLSSFISTMILFLLFASLRFFFII